MHVYFPFKAFIKTGRWRLDKEFTYLTDKGKSSSPLSDLRLPKGVEGLGKNTRGSEGYVKPSKRTGV